MPCKKAVIKQPVLPPPLKGSFWTCTPLAKQVHFEEAAETASPPQVKKKKDVRLKHMIGQNSKQIKKLPIAKEDKKPIAKQKKKLIAKQEKKKIAKERKKKSAKERKKKRKKREEEEEKEEEKEAQHQ